MKISQIVQFPPLQTNPRLYARLNGRQSRIARPATNNKLTFDMEEGLCQYLRDLDRIGTAARLPMVTGAADSILRRNHVDGGDPPTVGEKWTKRFLEAHPEFYIRKQKTLDINPRMHMILTLLGGSLGA